MMLVRDGAADLILSGHDEHLLVLLTATRRDGVVSQANFVVVTEVTLDKTEKDGKVSVNWEPNFRFIDTAASTPDPEIAALVRAIPTSSTGAEGRDRHDDDAARQPPRHRARPGSGHRQPDRRCDARRGERRHRHHQWRRHPRRQGICRRHELTRGDILAELPFGNVTVKLELTGEQIRAALENGFSQVREVAGRFPQVSGLTVEVDLKQPPGERIVSVMVGGAPLDRPRSTRSPPTTSWRPAATATQPGPAPST